MKISAKIIWVAVALMLVVFAFTACDIGLKDKTYNATDSSYFEFTEVEGGYAISVKDGATLPEKIKLPIVYEGKEVVEISGGAISGCSNLEKVIFEDDSHLELVGAYSFSNCKKLKSINLPSKVNSIGEGAFSFSALEEITVLESNVTYHSKDNCIIETASNSLVLGLENCKIPNYVTALAKNCFLGAFWSGQFDTITIPLSVKDICDYAFYRCTELKTVIFEEGSKLDEIGKSAFYNCEKLVNIALPKNIKRIEAGAFASTAITEIKVPIGVEYVGASVFANSIFAVNVYCEIEEQPEQWDSEWGYINQGRSCDVVWWCDTVTRELRYKYIQGGNYYVVEYLALSDTEITDIVIPANYDGLPVKEIADEAFSNKHRTQNIKSVTFSENSKLEKIGNNAFYGCELLTDFDFPDTVKEIGEYAFYACKNLSVTNLPSNLTKTFLVNKKSNTSSFLPPQAMNVGTKVSI